MEQTVTWWDDTWTAMDDDMLGWYGGPNDDAQTVEEAFHKARRDAVKQRRGIIQATCWVPFKGIVAIVICDDGVIRTVSLDGLRVES